MRDPDFDPVVVAFRESLAYRIARATIDRSAAAAGSSMMLSRFGDIGKWFASLTARRQVEAVAITVAIASVAHLVARELLPRYATSGLPWWWNAAAAVFAVIVALMAGPIAASWADSAPVKLWRRLVS